MSDGLSAVPTYNWNVSERSCANNDVICVIKSGIEDKCIPIEQLSFQVAAAHRPTSLGRAALKIPLFEIMILFAIDWF
jgi:hypothetical protein